MHSRRRWSLGVVGTVLTAVPAPSLAIEIVSRGALEVVTRSPLVLFASATGDVCGISWLASVELSQLIPGPGSPCAVWVTYGQRMARRWGDGFSTVPKFPAPVTSSMGSYKYTGLGTEDTTLIASSEGIGRWTSSEQSIGPFVYRSADLEARAQVSHGEGNRTAGEGVGLAEDPWVFTPEEPTELDVRVTLKNVELGFVNGGEAFSGWTHAQLEATGAFGIGSVPGSNPIADWQNSLAFPEDGYQSFDSYELFHQTFSLSPGITYWLTANLKAAAVQGTGQDPYEY